MIQYDVEIVRIGQHRMIKGTSKAAVWEKLLELVTAGANVIQRLRQVDGKWTAIVDCDKQFYKW